MERFGLSAALPATAIIHRDGLVAFRLLGPLKRDQLVGRLDYLLSGSQGPAPERWVSLAPDLPAHHHGDGHDHDHGEVGREDASSVPS
jgi:hypothetical protein